MSKLTKRATFVITFLEKRIRTKCQNLIMERVYLRDYFWHGLHGIFLVMLGHCIVLNGLNASDPFLYDGIKTVQMPLFMLIRGLLLGKSYIKLAALSAGVNEEIGSRALTIDNAYRVQGEIEIYRYLILTSIIFGLSHKSGRNLFSHSSDFS